MRNRWTGAALALLMAAFSAAMLPSLPARVATHFDLHGHPNGWMPRLAAAFLMPGVALAVWALMQVLPRTDPHRENYRRFGGDYLLVVNLTVLFMFAIQAAVLGSAAGWPVRMESVAPACVGLLFVCIGNYLPRTRRNWWFGVRTPWTLADDRVWRETHRVAGRTFVAGGILMFAAAFAPASVQRWLIGAAIATAAVIPVVYSYLSWRRETGRAA